MATQSAEAGQPPQAVGDPGGESPGAASAAPAAVPTAPVTPEVVLGRLAEAVAQLASASSGPPGGGGQWKESKWIKSPEAFNAKSLDEEVSLWPDWSFGFKNFMAVQDDDYRGDFEKAETATMWVSVEDYSPALRARSLRLYSVLASYLKGRALKILRSVTSGDGFRVWRQLSEELQPSSRLRTLAFGTGSHKVPTSSGRRFSFRICSHVRKAGFRVRKGLVPDLPGRLKDRDTPQRPAPRCEALLATTDRRHNNLPEAEGHLVTV